MSLKVDGIIERLRAIPAGDAHVDEARLVADALETASRRFDIAGIKEAVDKAKRLFPDLATADGVQRSFAVQIHRPFFTGPGFTPAQARVESALLDAVAARTNPDFDRGPRVTGLLHDLGEIQHDA